MCKYVLVGLMLGCIGICGTGCPSIYVDCNTLAGEGDQDGTSWETAYDTIQEGITQARSLKLSTGTDQIVCVAGGVYYENLIMQPGVGVWGGFIPGTTEDIEVWIIKNLLTFEGDLDEERITIVDGGGTARVVEGADNSGLAMLVLQNGYADNGSGGAYHNNGADNISFTGVVFKDNVADLSGGAVYDDGSGQQYLACRFLSNIAGTDGGALHKDAGDAELSNCLFINNKADVSGDGTGGALYYSGSGSGALMAHCTFTDNEVGDTGSCIYLDNSNELLAINSIFWVNPGGLPLAGAVGSSYNVTYSCVQTQPIFPGDYNINSDPRFLDRANYDLRLSYGSPCNNAGTYLGNYSDELASDILGFPRLGPVTADMGAYEGVTLVLRVDQDTPCTQNCAGASWDTAFATITQALDRIGTPPPDFFLEIWVAEGTYTECITLFDHVEIYGGFNGTESYRNERDPETNITTIDGNDQGSVVTLANYCVVDGFTITNGTATYGGGIYGDTVEHVVINNCIISDNVASDDGGGVYGGTVEHVVMNNCTISGNTASGDGGGIYGFTLSHVDINNCTISDNHATGGQTINNGGGIYGDTWYNVDINNCTISGNSAYNNGGGIYGDTLDDVDIIGCTISGNAAYDHDGGGGGGVYAIFATNITLLDCMIESNIVYAYGHQHGGGIYISVGCSYVTLTGCLIQNHNFRDILAYKRVHGGGVAIIGTYQDHITNITLQNCIMQSNSAYEGGGLYSNGVSDMLMQDCTIQYNHADEFGAIRISDADNLTLDNCMIDSNYAWNDGGIHLSGSKITLTGHNVISNNSAEDLYPGYSMNIYCGGGGIYSEDYIRLIGTSSQKCEIYGNYAEHGMSALLLMAREEITLQHCNVYDNHVGSDPNPYGNPFRSGGLIIQQQSIGENPPPGLISISDCVFYDNTSPVIGGGLIITDIRGSCEIQSTSFINNEATSGGGLLIMPSEDSISEPYILLDDCKFSANTAWGIAQECTYGHGGGFCIYSDRPSSITTTVSDCIFDTNGAKITGAAGYLDLNVTLSLVGQNTFTNNVSGTVQCPCSTGCVNIAKKTGTQGDCETITCSP